MEKESINICCICGNKFKGFGNNPWPLSENVDDRCCDDCNLDEVIPARVSKMKAGTKCPKCNSTIMYHDKYVFDKYNMCQKCYYDYIK